ncbi:MAG: YihY/virulence factor BrkB family protein [Methylobacillus sp.]|jgi:membrane protein|nr:YihY/virulence factor BrkB family protein [Methylobacillus sp.]
MAVFIKSTVNRTRDALHRHSYRTPFFVLRETLGAFQRHHGFGISASLAFYALFAMIPLMVLLLFLISHLVVSSTRAPSRLAQLVSNLLPEFSQHIMVEVYNLANHKAVWGVFGLLALFWAITPLAGALRTSFQTISASALPPSFMRRIAGDSFAVLGMLILLFLFFFSGSMLGKLMSVIRPDFVPVYLAKTLVSLALGTAMLTIFYKIFFPVRVSLRHIVIGSLVTVLLWMAMRPAFELFLVLKQSYGTMFGGMKNMFIAIGWLYYNFVAFLLGTELIATLRKKDALLIKNLFGNATHKTAYLDRLTKLFGRQYRKGDFIFQAGEASEEMFYLLSGHVEIQQQGKPARELHPGDYFGEVALLTNTQRYVSAVVVSEVAETINIPADNLETLLLEEPRIAMKLLRSMALRLRNEQDARRSSSA